MAEASLIPAPPRLALMRGGAFELLCACATTRPDPRRIERISSLDWSEFLRLAEHHGVLPLVAHNLTAHARDLPPRIQRALQSACAENLRSSLWFAAELSRIMQHFEQNRVRALPYKGPVLAQTAYGDVALRSFSDLDLLISPADFERARQALAEIGYRPSSKIPPAVERLWLRTGYERSFDGAAGKNLVELQWNLLPYFYAVDWQAGNFQFDDLWARAGRTALGLAQGASGVPCLSPEDGLLVLCLHAAKHLWTRLIWVADIAESLRVPGIDLAVVMTRARALGVRRILAVSLWLAENLLGASTPSPHDLYDQEVRLLGEECAVRMRGSVGYDFDSTAYFRQIFKLRERSGDRWRYLWRLALTPGPGDIAVVALPEALFPLYRAVRLGRLLLKCSPTLLRRKAVRAAHG